MTSTAYMKLKYFVIFSSSLATVISQKLAVIHLYKIDKTGKRRVNETNPFAQRAVRRLCNHAISSLTCRGADGYFGTSGNSRTFMIPRLLEPAFSFVWLLRRRQPKNTNFFLSMLKFQVYGTLSCANRYLILVRWQP